MEEWDQLRIEQYIIDQVEESLTLDYKAAEALQKSDGKKREVTKDISAMANSDGGIIIYGVKEFQQQDKKHLPEKIDPIDRREISKEWVDQVISNIRPKIDGVIVYPVTLDTSANDVVYVVKIPQSTTAHQAQDKRYYKRYNFESVAMEDYEIRDVMGRGQFPRIELEFEITLTQEEVQTGGSAEFMMPYYDAKPIEVKFVNRYILAVWAYNAGRVFAQYVNVFIDIPDELLPQEPDDEELLLIAGGEREKVEKDGVVFYHHYDDNTTRDYINSTYHAVGRSTPNYGPARHVPILVGRHFRLEDIELRSDFGEITLENHRIEWEVFADNAPALTGKIAVRDIRIVDQIYKAQ